MKELKILFLPEETEEALCLSRGELDADVLTELTQALADRHIDLRITPHSLCNSISFTIKVDHEKVIITID